MKRRIALLLVICLLTSMVPAATAGGAVDDGILDNGIEIVDVGDQDLSDPLAADGIELEADALPDELGDILPKGDMPELELGDSLDLPEGETLPSESEAQGDASEANDDSSDFTIENGVLTKYNGAAGDVVIPDGVTAIGDGAFYEQPILSITIPNSVKRIGRNTFGNCWMLKSIVIPDSVTEINEMAFNSCTALKEIAIPGGLTRIADSMFIYCSALTTVQIPDSVTEIGNEAFEHCGELSDVHFSNGLTSIGYGAFNGCSKLSSVTLPDSLKSIGEYAFDSSGLTAVTIPKNVTVINELTFHSCRNLTEVVIPNGVTHIKAYAFWGCQKLQKVTIPDSVVRIGQEAFEYCSSLEEAIIPRSVTKISMLAFDKCEKLTIKGFTGSAAEKYANENGIPFVAIDEPAPKISIPKALTLGVKETYALDAAGASFKSSNAAVAAVDKKGVVTAKKVGSATVTVKTLDGKKVVLKVTVMKAPAKVTVSPKTLSLEKEETYMLTATLPEKTASNKLTWTTSNKKVATVDSNGVVTAVKPGTATITVKTFNKKKAVCTLTVKKPFNPKTPEEAMNYLGNDDVSIEAIGRIEKKHDLIPLTGNESAEEKKRIKAVNKAAKKVNQQIDSCNKTYDKLCAEMKNYGKKFAKDASASGTKGNLTFTVADMKLVVDKSAMKLMQSGGKCSLKGETDDGVLKVACGKGTYYMTIKKDAIYITSTLPNANVRNTSNGLVSNIDIKKAYATFKDKATWISNTVASINSMIIKAIDNYDKLIKDENDFVRENAELYPKGGDDYLKIEKAARENINHYMDCKAFYTGVSAAFAAVNIAGEIASLNDIADKWGEVIRIDYHGHPTKKDIEEGKEKTAKSLNTNIKWAYGFFTSSAMMSLLSIGGVIASVSTTVASAFGGLLSPIAAGGVGITLSMIASSIMLAATANLSYKAVEKLDDKLHIMMPDEDTVIFGHYEQDGKRSNGPEPIEWIVLNKNGNNLTLISKYGLDCKPYNTESKGNTWDKCSLRVWLNGTFLQSAFTSAERAKLQTVTVRAYPNPLYSTPAGKDTNDKVYLMSFCDGDSLFSATNGCCEPTAYAWGQSNGELWIQYGNGPWWMRSPGEETWKAACIDYSGQYSSARVASLGVMVRPMVCLRLS